MRRNFYDIHVNTPAPIAAEALMRIATLYAIEADIRGYSAELRQQARQQRSKPVVGSRTGVPVTPSRSVAEPRYLT